MDKPLGQATTADILLIVIVVGLVVLFLVYCLSMFFITSKRKRERAQWRKQGVLTMAEGFHISGLPLQHNTVCQLREYSDKIVFQVKEHEFNLSKKKITDIRLQTNTTPRYKYKYSKLGSLIGGKRNGLLGALRGAHIRKVDYSITEHYFIFTYLYEDSTATIVFNMGCIMRKETNQMFENIKNSVSVESSVPLPMRIDL